MTLLALALLACNLAPDTTGTGTGTGTGTAPSGSTLADIQQGAYADGDTVTVAEAVVVGTPVDDGTGLFVQGVGQGAWNCMYLYLQAGFDDLFLVEGDTVTFTGTYTEYYDQSQVVLTDDSAIEEIGTAEVTIDEVDPSTVTDWEPWEACLISIGPATVTEGINSYGEAVLDNGLKLDNLFFDFDTEAGATYEDIIGVLSWSFGEWKINPRSEADLVGYTPGSGPEAVSVADIQQGLATGEVKLEGVVVTSGPDGNDRGFFVADPAGGEYSGLYVYVGSSGVPADVVEGVTVDLVGMVDEYDGDGDGSPVTELLPSEITVVGTATPPAPMVLTAQPSDWEPYEGVLVTLDGVGITGDMDDYGAWPTDWGLDVDDLFQIVDLVPGETYAITGFIHDYYGYSVNPRSQDDVQ